MGTTPRRRIKPDNEIPSRRISEHVIYSETEVNMTNGCSKKQKGAFGRVIDAIAAWEKAMDYDTLRITSLIASAISNAKSRRS